MVGRLGQRLVEVGHQRVIELAQLALAERRLEGDELLAGDRGAAGQRDLDVLKALDTAARGMPTPDAPPFWSSWGKRQNGRTRAPMTGKKNSTPQMTSRSAFPLLGSRRVKTSTRTCPSWRAIFPRERTYMAAAVIVTMTGSWMVGLLNPYRSSTSKQTNPVKT